MRAIRWPKPLLGACLGLLVLCSPLAGESLTIHLDATADANLLRGPGETHSNFGSVDHHDVGEDARALFLFDLAPVATALGPESLIESAAVELTVTAATGFLAGGDVRLHRLTRAWSEAAATWTCPEDTDLSDQNRDCAQAWGGGDFANPATSTVVLTDASLGRVAFPALPDVLSFLAGTETNFGWLVKLRQEGSGALFTSVSREGAAADAPRLTVVYDTDAVPPALSFVAPAHYFVVGEARPTIRLAWSDGGSGIDAASLAVTLDGTDITSLCITGAGGVECSLAQDLAEGPHALVASVADLDGNVTTVSRPFDLLLTPGPHTRELPAEADTTLEANHPNQRNGARELLEARFGPDYRALVRFGLADLVSLAARTEVDLDEASLLLWLERARNLGTTGRSVSVHRVSQAWVEEDATWNCPADDTPGGQTQCATSWAGGTFEPVADSAVTVATNGTGERSWSVLPSLEAFFALPPAGVPNHGFLLRMDPTGGGSPNTRWASRESDGLPHPRLRVVFRLPALADTVAPTLTFTAPIDPLPAGDLTPTVRVTYSDAGSGVNLASLHVFVDGVEITSGCVISATDATCEPPALAPGPHTATAQIADLAGNGASASQPFTVVAGDTSAPSLTIAAPIDPIPPGDTSPTVRVVYSDTGSGVDLTSLHVFVDGGEITASCTVNAGEATCEPPELAVGLHTASAQISDLAGNQATASQGFVIPNQDVTPPQIAVTAPTGLVVNVASPAIVLSYSDAGSGVDPATLTVLVDGLDISTQCVAGAAGATCTPPALGSSQHTVTASVRDAQGNQGTASGGFELVLDTAAPVLSFTSPAAPVVVTNVPLAVTVAWTEVDSRVVPASFVLLLDGVDVTSTCTVATDTAGCNPAIPEGPRQLEARIADVAGNLGSVSLAFLYDLDTVPPAIVWTAPGPNVFAREPVVAAAFSYADADSGLDLTRLSLLSGGISVADGCTFGPGQAACSVAAAAGPNTLTAVAVDRAGNVATLGNTFQLVLDDVAPSVAITQPAVAQVIGTSAPAITVTYADAGSGVAPEGLSVKVDGNEIVGGCTVGPSQVDCAPTLADGSHTINARVTDRAGNRAAAAFTFDLAAQDNVPPRITITTPAVSPVIGDTTPTITVEYSDALTGVVTSTLQVTVDSFDVSASCVAGPASATCEPPPLAAGAHRITVQIADANGNTGFDTRAFDLQLALAVSITSPPSGFLTGDETVDLAGTVDPAAETVEVHGVTGTLNGDGTFALPGVHLVEGSNTLTVVARNSAGGIGTATVSVILDSIRPQVVISTPPDGFVTTSGVIMVTGETNDPGSSNADAVPVAVEVNGVPAKTDHASYVVDEFLLQPGANVIEAVATDSVGNVGRTSIAVTYLPGATQKLEEMAGNGQSAPVGEELPQPLVVRLTDLIGNPLAGRTVRFEVVRGDGILSATGGTGNQVTTVSDELGFASATFRVGTRSGEGNHEVAVSSVGFPGSVVFCASASYLTPNRIVRLVGNNQTGALAAAAGAPMPKPLLTQVFDEMGNTVPGVAVTYSVLVGGGSFEGAPTYTTTTDADGKASAPFNLGPEVGIDSHVVKAEFPGLTEPAALFVITGLATGAEAETRVSGIVLDNEDQPVPGVTMSIVGATISAVTGADGRFTMVGAPVGTVHLKADGRTTPRAGTWPVLFFEFNTVSGQDNTIGMPVRMLPIDVENARLVGGPEDVVLPIAGIPGGSLTVFANSVSFPDGSRTGMISITQVHYDKVPMIAPMGSNFMLAWTVQPPGAHFDPPARIQIPNMGEEPGTVVDIFSFDHDMGEYVSAGSAEVTADGLSVVSRPGFGVSKSGWGGCTTPPAPPSGTCNPSACTECVNNQPVPRCGDCESCNGGTCEPKEVESVTATANGEEEQAVVGKDREVLFEAEAEANCDLAYEWDFGDGETSDEASPVHEYAEPGDYEVTVTVSCDDCDSGGSQTDSVMVKVITVDLVLKELPEEDEPAPNEEDPGAFFVVNDDDDNGNDMPDSEETGSVTDENELVMLTIDVDDGIEQGQLTLEAGSDGGSVKVWEEETKGTEVQLPKTWNFENSETPPDMLWVEGVAGSSGPAATELKLSYENGDQEPIVDSAFATIIDLDFEVYPDGEYEVSNDDTQDAVTASVFYKSFENPDEQKAVEDGANVEFTVADGSVTLLSTSATTEKGLAPIGVEVPVNVGSSGSVEAKLTTFRIDVPGLEEDLEVDFKAKTESIGTGAGSPNQITLSANRSSYFSDGTGTITLTAQVLDPSGQPVEDGTEVEWQVNESSSGFVSAQDFTAGGMATAVLAAPAEPIDQVVVVSSLGVSDSLTISVSRVSGSLTSSTASIDIDAGGTASLTATFSAEDGTPVFWTASNGTIVGDLAVSGGAASATLTSVGAAPGVVVVTANAGDRMLVWEGEFTSVNNPVRVERRFLMAGAGEDGTTTVTHPDGRVVTIPFFGVTPVTVTGNPGEVITVGVSGALPAEAFTFESETGGVVPGVFGGLSLDLGGATLDTAAANSGNASALFGAGDVASIAHSATLDFDDSFRVALWVRPATVEAATLVAKGAAWSLEVLSDGRVRGQVATVGGGTATVTSTATLSAGTFQYVELQLAGGDLRVIVGNQQASTPVSGSGVSNNTSPVQIGSGFAGHLDDLRIDASVGGFALVSFGGLDGAGQVTIGAGGTATFQVRATGLGVGTSSLVRREFVPGQTGVQSVAFGVFRTASADRSKTANGLGLKSELTAYALGVKAAADGQGQVQVVDPGFWETVWDVIQSFFGGDPTTTAGTVANIAGGIFIVGDIGAIAKNLWRMAFNPDAVNWPELILSAIGLITEFAPGFGEILDVPISAARAVVARIGDSPLARVWVKRFLDVIKKGDSLSDGEKALFAAIRDNPELGRGLSQFLSDSDAWKAFSKARKAFCPDGSLVQLSSPANDDEAEIEPFEPLQATAPTLAVKDCILLETFIRNLPPSVGAEAIGRTVKVLGEISPEAAARLAAQGPEALQAALDGMAKALTKVDAKHMKRVVENTFPITDAYPVTKLLEDLGKVADVPGFEGLLRSLKSRSPQVLGNRYELEAAIALGVNNLEFLTKGVKLASGAKTDIDIIANGILYQVKRSTGALGSANDVKAWVGKAVAYQKEVLGQAAADFSKIKYIIPPGTHVSQPIRNFLEEVGVEIIDTIAHVQ
ncbi:MAG TPA: PKD domain-containing protein [Thermoanaerobaculia bacterium]|nr:PKD domain-containing protein [Thermoanaerobaculia bacterium]